MITLYVKTKRLKMQFLFGEKGIGRRRLRRLSLAGTKRVHAHIPRLGYRGEVRFKI